ncbi:hypothetical protein DPMN_130469 [Dreissena polymorpha]|uniref:CCHC-type domain-containing protein n=1 Tax=Dreissena polymorpha TaxID=45954 RepID=A0A9D4H2Z2_DREPO|nr:hypothetical protein DPMN_130469 [Dreissena polymorpha]
MVHYTKMFGPLTGNAINKGWMERTLKVQGTRGASMAAVINLLRANGFTEHHIDAVASGPPGSLSYDVVFTEKAKMMEFIEDVPSGGLTHDGVKYFVQSYGKQLVDVRVHWLPVFIDNRVLEEMFGTFGTVISIKHETMDMDGFHVISGVRVVRLQIDEEAKNSIPHLLNFACGAKALLTVRGRQPLCLRCMNLGHIRGSCPENSKPKTARNTSGDTDGSQGGSWAEVVSRKTFKKTPTEAAPMVSKVVGEETPSGGASGPDRAGESTESVNPQTGGGKGHAKKAKTRSVFEGAPIEAGTTLGDTQGEKLTDVVGVTDDGAHHEMDTNIQGTKRSIDVDDISTPMPRNAPRSGPAPPPEDPFDGMFTQDSIQDGILGLQSPHAK